MSIAYHPSHSSTHVTSSLPLQPPLLDNPFAPELFVSGFSGIANIGGTIVLTLESARCDHGKAEPVLERVVIGRIAMTAVAAMELVLQLNQFLERQGMNPSKAVAQGASFQ